MSVVMSVPYEFSGAAIFNVQEINSSFATGTLKVMYLGGNPNGSYFTKDAVSKAFPSLKNVPIVCHWDDESGEIGGHDVTVVSDEDGRVRLKNLTEPCGVVPDHAVFTFQKESDESGVEHEYLVIDGVILWKRQDVFRHIKDDLEGRVKHSMEITVTNSAKMPDGLLDVRDFEFTALCLLENCEPCFKGSELELYSAQHFKQKMEQMLSELKESMNQTVTASFEADDKHPQQLTEGGETVLEEKKELVEKYGIDVESLDFSIDDFTIEELTEKFEAMQKESNEFALTSNILEEIYRQLDEVTIQKEWGESPRYYYADCDFEANEVYCWDTADWLLYGFTYSVDGDSVVIDYESKKRKKYVIADFDEGEQASPFAPVFEQMEQKIHDNAEWEAKYHTASDTIKSMQDELDTLKKFKSDTEAEKLQAKRDKIFENFEDLEGIDAFDKLRNDCEGLDLETLEEKLYAIRGKNGTPANFSTSHTTPKLKVHEEPERKSPYGDLFAKYGYDID